MTFATIWLFSLMAVMIAAFLIDTTCLCLLPVGLSISGAFICGGIYGAVMMGPIVYIAIWR